ncbi:MAG TPA: hypothetical protein VJ951_07990 [Bacteroidales bacterium]|nr:hypothetical protein [Bacteroidales bacterium]
MKLIDYHKLKKRKYAELVESLGGRFSWLKRLKMGGTGVGGLTLPKQQNPDVMLRFPDTTEPVKFSIEILQKGILLGFNNTKEVKILPFIQPRVSFDIVQEDVSLKGLRKVQIVELLIDDSLFVVQTDGWNAKEVFTYFSKLNSYFNQSENTV